MSVFYIRFLILLLATQLIVGCQPSRPDIRIAAAASTKFALDSIVVNFNKEHNLHCWVSYASSGLLASQIREGAPYDIFLSADETFSRRLFDEKKSTKPIEYCLGSLVFWTMDQSFRTDSMLTVGSISRTIALPNPKVAPYGRAAVQALKGLGLYERLNRQYVYGESVGQTSHFITSGAVKGGFTALSITNSPEWRGRGFVSIIDRQMYQPLVQTYSLVNSSNVDAVRFCDYLVSPEAQQILRYFGYQSILPDTSLMKE